MEKALKLASREPFMVNKPKGFKKKGNPILHKILSKEEKIELMEKLVKNKEDEIIKTVQKEVIKKGKQANDKIQRKL